MLSAVRKSALAAAIAVLPPFPDSRTKTARLLMGAGLSTLALAIAVGALLAGLLLPNTPPAQAQGALPAKVWEATLTVEGPGKWGYIVNSQHLAYGDLTPNSGAFTWPGDDSGQPLYVHSLYVNGTSGSAPLVFGFADRYHYNPSYPHGPNDGGTTLSRFLGPRPASFDGVLCVSGRAYPFDETDFSKPARSRSYIDGYVTFRNAGLEWGRGARAQVSLWAVADKDGNHGHLCNSQSDGLPRLDPIPDGYITSDPHARVADANLPCQTSGSNPPMADANGDFNVRYDRTALLDGSLSRNHQGNVDDTLSYRWVQIKGPAAVVLDHDSIGTDFHMPLFADAGRIGKPPRTELEFLLCVTAQHGAQAYDTMLVNMVDTTLYPFANTGPDQVVEPGATVTLEGDGSHNPYEDLTGANPESPWRMDYLWEQLYGPDVVLSDATAVNPTFTAPTDAGEMLAFRLTVTTRLGDRDISDGGEYMGFTSFGTSGNAFVFVKFANAGPDIEASPGDTVNLWGTGSRNPFTNPKTNQGLTYSWAIDRDSIRKPDGQKPDRGDPDYTFWYSSATSNGWGSTSPLLSFALPYDTPLGTSAEFRLSVGAGLPGIRSRVYSRDTMRLTVAPGTSNSQAVGESGQAESNSAPVFDDGSETTRSLPENTAAGEDVGDPITATDADGDALTYSLSGTDAGSFTINGAGQITTKSDVVYDYEMKVIYTLTVEADDGNGAVSAIAVTVSLTDVNEAPSFTEGSDTTRSLLENTAAGEKVGAAIAATDPDGDPLTYSLSGTDAASFGIDSETGQLTTTSGVTYDFETKSSYTLTVSVSDGKGSAASIAITVTLTNVNEAPAFSEGASTTREVAENSPASTKVGDAIAATDPDGGDTLTYSLSGTDASSFEIGNSTGQLTTKSDVEYDYETQKRYSLTVNVSDGKGGTASIAVTVNLTNVDEAPPNRSPVFDDGTSASRSIAENSVAGVNVGDAVTATDLDGDTLTYTLSGTDAGSFAINRDTGQLTTVASADYDYETKSSYELTVEADDGNGGAASISVTVTLTNVDEAKPVTACFTNLGTLTSAAEYAGSWDDADCKAHHQDSRGRYFHFTLSEETTVSVRLSAGALYVSKDTPQNGWGTAPKGTYEHRKNVRRNNGKLVHDGSQSAFDGTLAAGATYTVEAAGGSGDFTLSIGPR